MNYATPGPPAASYVLAEPARAASRRLVIIEDFRSMADMLGIICGDYWSLNVTACEQTGALGLQAVTRLQPDIVILDLSLPDTDGLTLLPQLKRSAPDSRIILFSSQFNDFTLGRLAKLPWSGLVDKAPDGLRELREAIDMVASGVRYVSPSVRQHLNRHQLSTNPFSRMISDREQEVLVCIARALSDEEIAGRLRIDASTVHTHRKSLMRKLDQHSTPKLMHLAIKHGYSSLPLP